MLRPSSIRRRFGTILPLWILQIAMIFAVVTCLHFLAGFEQSYVNGSTYSIHFAGMPDLILFAAAIGLIIACYKRLSQWLVRRDDDDVKREKRFFARVDEYNEVQSKERPADS